MHFFADLKADVRCRSARYATIDGENLTLEGIVGSLDGTVVFREQISGNAEDAENLGTQLADALIRFGARELLDSTREQVAASSQVTM